ncbi:MAG: hypothetical protein SNJ77_12280 [Cytophagales bacterium]
MEKVFKVTEYTAMSKVAKKAYDESLKNYNDLINTLRTSEREGFEKGFNKGIEQITPILEEERKLKEEERQQKEKVKSALRKTVLELRKMNHSLEQIASITGLGKDEINEFL